MALTDFFTFCRAVRSWSNAWNKHRAERERKGRGFNSGVIKSSPIQVQAFSTVGHSTGGKPTLAARLTRPAVTIATAGSKETTVGQDFKPQMGCEVVKLQRFFFWLFQMRLLQEICFLYLKENTHRSQTNSKFTRKIERHSYDFIWDILLSIYTGSTYQQ